MVNPPRRASTSGRRIPFRAASITRRNAQTSRTRLPVARRLFAIEGEIGIGIGRGAAPLVLPTPSTLPPGSYRRDRPPTPFGEERIGVEFTDGPSTSQEEAAPGALQWSPGSPPRSYSPTRTPNYPPSRIEAIPPRAPSSVPNYSPVQDHSNPSYSPVQDLLTTEHSPRTPDYPPPPAEGLSDEAISEILEYLNSEEFLDSW